MNAATSTNSAPAERARIGGWQPFSSCDWPGRLAAVVFLAGCPWRCGYCHNPGLLQRRHGQTSWPQLRAQLQARRGLLDGVVFSGGEPLTEPALPALLAEVRAMGFATGLHSGGSHPERLQRVLPLLDWVGLDIKTLTAQYPAITAVPGSGERAAASLALLQASGVAYECRSTLHPALHDDSTLTQLAAWLAQRGVRHYAWQLLRPGPQLPQPFAPIATGWPTPALQAAVASHFAHFELRAG
ncbi:anaerobic ribonucleoside-triphosphate reductase activating protein [Vogesella indigofera]|uniref:anaerobic ribonucleoside-triphosphate reductase activating protein n=1 Tax=Vogesella indigofera TaxID=45465 RepID=UPI00234F9567|nr:anaerobic ribonucleoside-triphosphate reductase activating protein [Vogesella indigofera]MDC7712291.1 anaerobic ribonucleoside-triphosphate reductase activating protein [Vogesella indigofera]